MNTQNLTEGKLSPLEEGLLNIFEPHQGLSLVSATTKYVILHRDVMEANKAVNMKVAFDYTTVPTALRSLLKKGYLEIYKHKDYPYVQFRLSYHGWIELYEI
jgi:hypothetical protein